MKTNNPETKASRYFIMAAFTLIMFAIIFMGFVHNADINLKLKAIASGIFLATYFSLKGFTIENREKHQTEEEVSK